MIKNLFRGAKLAFNKLSCIRELSIKVSLSWFSFGYGWCGRYFSFILRYSISYLSEDWKRPECNVLMGTKGFSSIWNLTSSKCPFILKGVFKYFSFLSILLCVYDLFIFSFSYTLGSISFKTFTSSKNWSKFIYFWALLIFRNLSFTVFLSIIMFIFEEGLWVVSIIFTALAKAINLPNVMELASCWILSNVTLEPVTLSCCLQ